MPVALRGQDGRRCMSRSCGALLEWRRQLLLRSRCDPGTSRVPRKPHFRERSIEDGVGLVEGSHDVVEHLLHRTVDHMVGGGPRVPSDPSSTPHFCKGAGVHYPRGLHDRRARCTVGNSVCVDHFASGASERSPTCDEGYTATRRTTWSVVPPGVSERCWEQLDQVDLVEWFLNRVPMLKTCRHFFRGRLRQCFSKASGRHSG